jgi:RNA-binding protein 26
MRGDLCPYDHGTDPVVLEDVPLSRVLTFGPHGAQAPGSVPVVAVPEVPPPGSAGPNGNAPPPHLPIASLPPPHLRNQHHANMGSFHSFNRLSTSKRRSLHRTLEPSNPRTLDTMSLEPLVERTRQC